MTGRFGLRTKLAGKGITFSSETIYTYQNIVDGGADTGGEYGGSNDYELRLDLGKMRLMPGTNGLMIIGHRLEGLIKLS